MSDDFENRNDQPLWKQLEIVCADIERGLAPGATVTHDDRILGRSGAMRKIDISVRQKIGTYSPLIVIDCKRHAVPVSRSLVAAFGEQVRDLRAHMGVMISESGFDSGAKAVADDTNILLRTFSQADQSDWESIFGKQAWASITHADIENEMIFSLVDSEWLATAPDVCLFGFDYEKLGTIRDCWWRMWGDAVSRKIGNIEIRLTPAEGPLYFQTKQTDAYTLVDEVLVKAKLTAHRYIVNLAFAGGRKVHDLSTGTDVFKEVESEGFEWQKVLESQDGEELTPEQYEAEFVGRPSFEITNAKKFLRVVSATKNS